MSQMSEPLSYPVLAQSITNSYPTPTQTNLPKPEQHGRNGCLILHDTSENENMCRFMSSGDGCFQAADAVQAHAIPAASWREKCEDAVHSAKHHDSPVHIGRENAPQNMRFQLVYQCAFISECIFYVLQFAV